jgi:outer membrane lipoprotein
LRSPTPQTVSADEVRAAPDRFIGSTVRWGGSILGVRNGADDTEVELLARPLDKAGEPRIDEPPQGRFFALVPGFLDPAEYSEDRLLTVTGVVKEVVTRDVGEYPYRYPVVRAVGRYLWPETSVTAELSPWPYDPWYGWGNGPWYHPYGPYPPWYW